MADSLESTARASNSSSQSEGNRLFWTGLVLMAVGGVIGYQIGDNFGHEYLGALIGVAIPAFVGQEAMAGIAEEEYSRRRK